MWFRRNKVWLGRISLFLMVILLSGLSIFGCAPRGATAKGWSGATIADGKLFLGSMEGKLVALDISSGARLWSVSVPLGGQSQTGGGAGCGAPAASVAIYGTPVVSGEMVYVGGYVAQGSLSQGKVYAFGQDEPRWAHPPGEGYLNGPVVGGLVVSRGRVYFGAADGKVYALDAADGHKLAEFQTGDKIWSTPVIDGDTLYIGSFDRKLYVLDAESLEPKGWKEFETESAIVAAPLIYNDTVYLASFDRHLYAINATDGSLRWKFQAGNWFWASPVVYNNTIYAPCLDHKLYVLNADTGAERVPAFDLGSPISSSPVVVEGKIIIAAEGGAVYSLDAANNQIGKLDDLTEKIQAPLSASEGSIYIHTEKDSLYALELQTGALRKLQFK